MAVKLVTIAQFDDYIEAELAKQLLADYGISAVVTGLNASNLFSMPAIEMPKLEVPEDQAQKAKEILQSDEKKEL
jgi:hypothetical protein